MKNLKTAIKEVFLVHNNNLNLCGHGQVENCKWIFCCRKTGFKIFVVHI